MKNKSPQVAYRYWQDRATAFYIASRILRMEKDIPEVSAFCAYQAIENMLKAALEFYSIQFPNTHSFSVLTNLLGTRLAINIPNYFDDYQEVPRYPETTDGRGSGLKIEAFILDDLDGIISKLCIGVGDRSSTRLKHFVKNQKPELFKDNKYFSNLKSFYA